MAAPAAKTAQAAAGAAVGGPVGIGALAAAKQLAQSTTGLVQQFEQWAARPLFTDQHVTTVTHVARNGDLVTRTKTAGTAISNGMVFGMVMLICLYELANSVSHAFNDIESWADPFNVANWTIQTVETLTGQGAPKTVSAAVPPTFMAALSQLGVQLTLPFIAGGQQFGQQGTAFVAKYLTPGGNQ